MPFPKSGTLLQSAAAMRAASRALFSTRAMLVFRLAPPVNSRILSSRNGVTAFPVMRLSAAARRAWQQNRRAGEAELRAYERAQRAAIGQAC